MSELSPAAARALALAADQMRVLEAEMAGLDRQGRAEYLTQHIAARQFAREGQPPIDDAAGIARTVAISLLVIALSFDD